MSALVVRKTFASILADWRRQERVAGRRLQGKAEPSLWRAFVFDKGWTADRFVVVIPSTGETPAAHRHAYRQGTQLAQQDAATDLWEQHRREQGLRVPSASSLRMRWVGERVAAGERWLSVPFAVDGRLLEAQLFRRGEAGEVELILDGWGLTRSERDDGLGDPPPRFGVLRWDQRWWRRRRRATWLRSEPWNLWRTPDDRERLRAHAEAAMAEALEQVGGWR